MADITEIRELAKKLDLWNIAVFQPPDLRSKEIRREIDG
jgi:uncharacterized protein YfkK (UPF0435 family)